MRLSTMDIVVTDVAAATTFFTDVLGLTARFAGEGFAELETGGGPTIMLTGALMVPTEPVRGVALHFMVLDVPAELERVRANGATVLLEPTKTDWGTEMAMIAGPEDSIISLYRPMLEAQP